MRDKRATCAVFRRKECGLADRNTDVTYDCDKCVSYEADGTFTPIAKQIFDAVNHPNHYTQGGIECIDALKAATTGLQGIEAVCTANAIKYLWRWKHKNGVQDIDKAIWYLNRLKQEIKGDAE